MARSGYNITDRFEFAYKVGLLLLTLEVIISNIIAIYFRVRTQLEEERIGIVSAKLYKINWLICYSEWIIRASTVLVSIYQYSVISSTAGHYCAKTKGILSTERQWMISLIAIQLSKGVAFTYW